MDTDKLIELHRYDTRAQSQSLCVNDEGSSFLFTSEIFQGERCCPS